MHAYKCRHVYIHMYIYHRRDLLLLLEEENIGLIERPSLRPELEFGNACVIIRTAGMYICMYMCIYVLST
jgi:hypothetical protein